MRDNLTLSMKILIIIECCLIGLIVWSCFSYLPYRINLIIFLIVASFYIFFQYYIHDKEYPKKKLIIYSSVIFMIVAVLITIGSSPSLYVSQGDAFHGEYQHSTKRKIVGAETFVFITTEQISNRGNTNPQGSVRFPSMDYIYQKKMVSATNIKYSFKFESTMKFDNLTINLYGKNDTVETNQRFLTKKQFLIVNNGTKIVDNINLTIWYIESIFYVEFSPTNNPNYIHFEFNISLNPLYYQTAIINNGQTWLDISSQPRSDSEEWGYTTTMEFSLDGLINNRYYSLPVWMGLIIGIFLIAYLLGFLTQNGVYVRGFYFILCLISAIILLVYLVDAPEVTPFVSDLIRALRNLNKNFLIPEWFKFTLPFLIWAFEMLSYIVWIFLWGCTIGVALLLCFYLMEMLTFMSVSQATKDWSEFMFK